MNEVSLSAPLCIYHGNCMDGFASAVIVKHNKSETELFAGVYQTPPPDVEGRDVILVDFSYPKAVLLPMLEVCSSMVILDHHKTAAADLLELKHPKLYTIFDMERSGASITWDYFHRAVGATSNRPELVNIIEDRDLWKFKIPRTRNVCAAIFSHEYEYQLWHTLLYPAFGMAEANLVRLNIEGEAIERKHHKDIAELLKVVTREMVIGTYRVKVANLPYIHSSDAAHELATGAPFGACYWDTPEGRIFSLRSTEETGIDVSAIAKLYGGGGHNHAAGFKVSYKQAAEFEIDHDSLLGRR